MPESSVYRCFGNAAHIRMNWLDLIIVILTAVGLMKGLFDGLVRQVISIVSFLIAVMCAKFFADPLRDLITSNFTIEAVSPVFITAISYLLAFILIIVLLSQVGKLIHRLVRLTPLSLLNFFAGGLLGMILVLLILSLSFNIFTLFDPHHSLISKQSRNESVLYNRVENIIPFFYPVLDNYIRRKPEPVLPAPSPQKKREYPPQVFV